LEPSFTSDVNAFNAIENLNTNIKDEKLKIERNKQSTAETNNNKQKTIKEKSKFLEVNKDLIAEQEQEKVYRQVKNEQEKQEEENSNNIKHIENPNINNHDYNNNPLTNSAILERNENTFPKKDYSESSCNSKEKGKEQNLSRISRSSKVSSYQSNRKKKDNDNNITNCKYNTNTAIKSINAGNEKSVKSFIPEGAASCENYKVCQEDIKCAKNNFIKEINEDNFKSNFRKINPYFTSIGVFYLENSDKTKKKYFNIFHRKIILHAGNAIDNFFFQDITNLVDYQLNQFQESIKKQKIFAKISHEFKTPLNSIIGMINIIKDSDQLSLSKATKLNLDVISNLSNYVIFLISDVIQYVNLQDLKDIDDLKLNISQLDFKEIVSFCFQILNSLLFCNKSKNNKISTSLYLDPKASYFTAESDEIRIKQVILNFMSNAVKFTIEGKIEIECKQVEIENSIFMKICVSDTGVGIKEEEKALLFKDFGVIENDFKALSKS